MSQLLAALPELIRQLCDPEIEWVEDPKRPDSRTYRGHDVLASFERWLEGFDQYGIELERIVDFGDRVFVACREEGTGVISGATADAALYQVITVRRGRRVATKSSTRRQTPSKPPGCRSRR